MYKAAARDWIDKQNNHGASRTLDRRPPHSLFTLETDTLEGIGMCHNIHGTKGVVYKPVVCPTRTSKIG